MSVYRPMDSLVEVMPSVQEVSMEAGSPTQVTLTATTSGDAHVKAGTRSIDQSANSISAQDDPDGSVSQVCDAGESFRNHLMNLLEEYQEQMLDMGRQLREQREVTIKMKQKVDHYRVKCYNSKVIWEVNQAEIKKLRARLQKMEKQEKVKHNFHEKLRLLEKENKKFKDIFVENLYLKRKLSNVTQTAFENIINKGSGEEIKDSLLPKLLASPYQRRHSAGTSPDDTFLSHSEQTSSKSPLSEAKLCIALNLTPNKSPNSPIHSSSSRHLPSRRQNRVSPVSTSVRGSSSVGNATQVISDGERENTKPVVTNLC